ncbi:family 20 glycosylhydrolase [Luteimicrobium xylanilyticum]|uniref:beta-N-acetylhexosaminidase n=1 Tax=Luteimicrobium xylanilyticum TaxID=1133546 RepID=A0A5P9QCV1_9MICO|nr:family 20 glycosylhydrolase [Luteimicrobium xylanilyticum]QFU98940.1 Beta-N-acetylhexosaminidase [Luteimicrobium xylanilyticum]
MNHPSLVPWPRHVALSGHVPVPEGLRVRLDPAAGLTTAVSRWFAAELRLVGVVTGTGALPVTVVIEPRAVAHLPEPDGVEPGPRPADERYVLTIGTGDDARPTVELVAAAPEGVVRGLATLVQLAADTPGTLPVGHVEDGPRFRWRGLSLDVVRHRFGADEIRAVVDLLARYRMRVLHLHLTDSQAWRLGSRRRRALGSGDDPLSPDALAGLVRYAADRGIVVLPEADLPGHAAAALAAYPDLGGPAPHPLLGHLDLARPDTPAFVADVVRDLAEASPSSFVHVGGDEPFGMRADDYDAFAAHLVDAVHATGRRAVVWQEAVRGGALTPDDVLQYWIGAENRLDTAAIKRQVPESMHPFVDRAAELFAIAPQDVPAAVRADVPILVSSNDTLYLDRPYAEPAEEPEAEARRARVGMPGYPSKTLSQMYDVDPAALPELDGARLAGIEAAVWCESVESFDDLAFLLLPRLAGVAEHAWGVGTTWTEHHERLARHRPRWRAAGWGAAYWPARAAGRDRGDDR